MDDSATGGLRPSTYLERGGLGTDETREVSQLDQRVVAEVVGPLRRVVQPLDTGGYRSSDSRHHGRGYGVFRRLRPYAEGEAATRRLRDHVTNGVLRGISGNAPSDLPEEVPPRLDEARQARKRDLTLDVKMDVSVRLNVLRGSEMFLSHPGVFWSHTPRVRKGNAVVARTFAAGRADVRGVSVRVVSNLGVVVIGPRQVGKTKLAREVAAERDAVYLDLELPSDLAKISDVEALLRTERRPFGDSRRSAPGAGVVRPRHPASSTDAGRPGGGRACSWCSDRRRSELLGRRRQTDLRPGDVEFIRPDGPPVPEAPAAPLWTGLAAGAGDGAA